MGIKHVTETCLCGEGIVQRPHFDDLWFDRLGSICGEDGHPHAPQEYWALGKRTRAIEIWLGEGS